MIVVVFERAPDRLRGFLGRWLLEVSPTTYVGRVTQGVRREIWALVKKHVGAGSAWMIYACHSEQGFDIMATGSNASRLDLFDGLALIRRHHRTK